MTTPTTDTIASGAEGASLFTPSSTKPEVVTLQAMIEAYLQEYEVRQFRINIARCRVAHLRAYFGEACLATDTTAYRIRQYQVARRQQGAATQGGRLLPLAQLAAEFGIHVRTLRAAAKDDRSADGAPTRVLWLPAESLGTTFPWPHKDLEH